MADTHKLRTPTPHEKNHFEYIGMISAEWANLEFHIDLTTWRLGGIKPEVGACLSANLGSIHMKLRSLYALLELNNVSKETLKKFRDLQNRTSGTADKRNRVIHDPWMTIVSPQNTQFGQYVNRANNKGREFGPKPIPVSDLIKLNHEIHRRLAAFFKLRECFADEIPSFGKTLP